MEGYYLCALGEQGFDHEGLDNLKKKSKWIQASMESHELFADFAGPFTLVSMFHNGNLIKDINAILKELA